MRADAIGVIERVHGCHVFPDTVAIDEGDNPQWLYTVRVRRPRVVGRGCRPDAQGLDRGVRALSRSGVMALRPRWRRSLGRSDGAGIDVAAGRRATEAVPSIPRDADGPVFREPWEAQAFAMALALYERGLFSWTEWAATLGEEIKARAGRRRSRHRRHLLPALAQRARAPRRRERRGGRGDARALSRRLAIMPRDRTPHGTPIELARGGFRGPEMRLRPLARRLGGRAFRRADVLGPHAQPTMRAGMRRSGGKPRHQLQHERRLDAACPVAEHADRPRCSG